MPGCRRPVDAAAASERRRRRAAGVLPGLPLLPAARPRAPRRGVRRAPGAGGRTCAATFDVLAPVLADPEQPAALRFQQTSGAVMAKGVEDCAFYRYVAAHLAERGRRRPERVLAVGRGVPRRDGRAAARPAAGDDDPVDPRHQARRGRPGPDRRARRGPRASGPTTLDRLHAAGAAARPRLRQPALAGRRRRLAGRRATGCTPTPRRRCARPATAPRGPTRTRRTRRPCTPPSTRRSTTPRCAQVARRASSTRDRRARLEQLPVRQAGAADDARRARRLPGQRAVGAEPGRPRQPAAGRLRPSGASCSTGRRRRAARPHPHADDHGPRSCSSPRRALHRAPGPAGAASRRTRPSAAAGDAAEHLLAFDRGGAVTVVTRLPRRPRPRGGWGDTGAARCPRVGGPTCSPAGSTSATARRARPARRPTRSRC